MGQLEDAIYTLLSADAGVAAMVGGRIYPSAAQQGCARPYAVFHLISQTRFPAMGQDAKDIERRLQIDAYAQTQTEVIDVIAAIGAALNRKGGMFAGVTITDAYEAGVQDFGLDDTTRDFRRSADYLIYYEG